VRFGHEQLDVYKLSLEYVAWVYSQVPRLKSHHRNAREQLLRASQSVPLNIAEGNGKSGRNDRRHFFEIARGSALECAAIQDVLQIGNVLTLEENNKAKQYLIRIVSMLTKLSLFNENVKEAAPTYGETAPVKELHGDEYDYEYEKQNGSNPPTKA